MPKLKRILVIHTTSNDDDRAGSSADFSLEISRPGQDVTLPFPKNPGQRKRGKLDTYEFDVSQHNVDSESAGFQLLMSIKSDDGWLPASFFVLGQTEDDYMTVLGNHPYWERWFDRGGDAEGEPAHEISGFQDTKAG